MAAKSIYIWNDETEIITREIEKRSTFLKIVLKTKNDLFFLTKWIDFYLSFLPPESIIICDNMSDDIDHLAYYDELPDEIVVVRYSGFHNYLHVVNAFPSLYRSLERSSEYFCFLDTDEFLVHIDDTMVPRTDTIVPFLRSLQDIQAIPSCWLNNVIKSKKLFECGSQPAVLESGRMWGKPLVRSRCASSGIIHHNEQLDRRYKIYDGPKNLFLLHLKHLDISQRIKSNFLKLQSRRIIPRHATLDFVEAIDVASIEDPVARSYINELIFLSRAVDDASSGWRSGVVELEVGQSMKFYSNAERANFSYFLSRAN